MGKRHFRKYFEWVGDVIYIKAHGQNTSTTLASLLNWWDKNCYELPSIKREINRLDNDDNEILEKIDALYKHLGLEFKKEVNKVVKIKKGKK